MNEPGQDILDEVENMIEAGALSRSASREALEYMASKYLAEELRHRTRENARNLETEARMAARAARPERSAHVIAEKMSQVASWIAQETHTNWTMLLDKTFALPTGEQVTWAAATVEQHEYRATSLEIMAAGDLQTAALHREAVAVIRERHAMNLGDAMEAVAA